jgi:hypothetical protein
MNADSIFNIGATHSVCEDYAIAANPTGANPYVVLSDGCSTSPDTDIGARLLVKAAEQVLKADFVQEPTGMHNRAVHLALNWSKLLELPIQAIDATLLTAHVFNDEVVASCSGDGLIVVESTDGEIDVYSISYPSGYPLYPAYIDQPARLELFTSTEFSYKQVQHFHSSSKDAPLQLESTRFSNDITEVIRIKAVDCKVVSLCSDGLHSFLYNAPNAGSRSVEPVNITDVIKELLSFKSLNGAFVARRVKKFMKECGARGWQHSDDLSIAAIHVGGGLCSTPKPFPA